MRVQAPPVVRDGLMLDGALSYTSFEDEIETAQLVRPTHRLVPRVYGAWGRPLRRIGL